MTHIDIVGGDTGSGVEKPIGEAVLQIDMLLGKERKINVRGENLSCRNFKRIY